MALADYNANLRLDPGNNLTLIRRGEVYFYLEEFKLSANDFEQVAIKNPDAFVVLWLHLARRRAGENDSEEFKTNISRTNLDVWPGPIVAWLARRMTMDQVIKASDADAGLRVMRAKSCEFPFFLGELLLIEKRSSDAQKYLSISRDHCLNNSERGLAIAKLRRLSK
jgi:lipoprotein NlpI